MVSSKKVFKLEVVLFAVLLVVGMAVLSSKVFAQATEAQPAPAAEGAQAPAPAADPEI